MTLQLQKSAGMDSACLFTRLLEWSDARTFHAVVVLAEVGDENCGGVEQ